MATMSPSTFDPLKAYVNVRLQQGVPIVDADLNELDDIRKFELRAFLKWFVGDGVPEGNDGFTIVGGLDNDLTISAGIEAPPAGAEPDEIGLGHVGRLIVDGLDVIIAADLRYSAQELHAAQPGAAARAAALGVPVVPALTTPTADVTQVAYLDVWELLVTPHDDPLLVHGGLGVETCARTARKWVVRVGVRVPQRGAPEYLAGHQYYALAVLRRRAGEARIPPSAVRDLRERRLLMPPAHLLTDTLDIDPVDYRRGAGRPAVSLRRAINALLAGQLPTGPELSVAPAPGVDLFRRGCTADAAGGLVAAWHSPRVGSLDQVVAARLAPGTDGFGPPVVVTGGPEKHLNPTVVALPGGQEVLVAYQQGINDADRTDVRMKRGTVDALVRATETPVAGTDTVVAQWPFAVSSGDLVVLFTQLRKADGGAVAIQWAYRRYNHTDNTFLDPAPLPLSTGQVDAVDLHAMAADGKIWVAYSDGAKLNALRLDPVSKAVDNRTTVAGLTGNADVFVLAISATSAIVFYDDGTALQALTFGGNAWSGPQAIPGTGRDDSWPAAVLDADGTVYLASASPVAGARPDIVLRRRNPVTGDWTPPQRITDSDDNDQRPHAVLVPRVGLWVLWMSRRGAETDVFAKQVITAI